MASAPYAALIGALPHLGQPFTARERPIVRRTLDRRLRALDPADARSLYHLEAVLRWQAADAGTPDAEHARRAHDLMATLTHPTLAWLARRRLETRTVVAALRRRRDGRGPPAPEVLGHHRRGARIRRHWRDPDLGVRAEHPWLGRARACLDAGDALGLEKLLLECAWRDLDTAAQEHAFDFPAVAIYVLRWDIMDRWMRYDGDAATQRLRELASAALTAYGPVLDEGESQDG